MAPDRCPSCLRELNGSVCSCGYPGKGQNGSHRLPVGTLLRSRYQIGRCLGQGGFGITYLAWDKLMQQKVAVKEFYPGGIVFRRASTSLAVECSTDEIVPRYEYSKERFLREASALVQFKDIPEVVDILDFAEENNTAYIVMEFVRGVDLAKYIRMKGGKLSVDETFRILRPVMEALAKVHKGGIVHRDISPDNIILDPMGGAKLLDFGAVRAVEDPHVDKSLNRSTETILKHGFAPLEQYNTRGSLGPWTDEYAMCATVWYCLTGQIPEDASSRVTEGIDPDWSSIEGLPKHQQKALEKGFSCRARDRYENMDALIGALFSNTIPEHPKQSGKIKFSRPEREHIPQPSPDRQKGADAGSESTATGRKCISLIASILVFSMLIYAVNISPASISAIILSYRYDDPFTWQEEHDASSNYEISLFPVILDNITTQSVFPSGRQDPPIPYAGTALFLNPNIDTAVHHTVLDDTVSNSTIRINDKKYYYDDSVRNHSSWRKRDGKWYYYGNDGIMATGWMPIGDEMYYFDTDGAMVTGWRSVDDNRYYFRASGQMEVGTHMIDGIQYTFGPDGALIGK